MLRGSHSWGSASQHGSFLFLRIKECAPRCQTVDLVPCTVVASAVFSPLLNYIGLLGNLNAMRPRHCQACLLVVA